MPDTTEQPGTENDISDFDSAFEEFASGEPGESDPAEEPELPARDEQGRYAAADGGGGDEAPDVGSPTIDWESDSNPWKEKYQADLAQQSALQQQAAQQQQQLAQLQQQSPAEQLPSDNSSDGLGKSDAEWAALKEDFPEMVQAFENRLATVEQNYQARYQKLEQQFQPIQQQANQQQIQVQYQQLATEHPDYQQVAASAEFKGWVANQPQVIQQMMSSDSAADAAYLLSSFKQTQPRESPADAIKAKRQQQLEQSRTVPRRGAAKVQDDGDFDSMFNHFAKQANA